MVLCCSNLNELGQVCLVCVYAQLFSRIWLCDPVDCSPLGLWAHGTL